MHQLDTSTTRLLIVQPYIPQYRYRFFRDLRALLATEGIQLAIAAPAVTGRDKARGDDWGEGVVDFPLRQLQITLGVRTINYRLLKPVLTQFQPDLVIVEQAIKNLENWPLLLWRRGIRAAMWGHGRTYSSPQSHAESCLKHLLTRRARWFFAYTQAGKRYVLKHGFPAANTTVVWNSSDTHELNTWLSSVTAEDVSNFRYRKGLQEGSTGIFLGGLDARKGITFLIDSAEEIRKVLPDFTLLIGGSGELGREVSAREASGAPIRYLGRTDGWDKALALRAADAVLVPEWVGLVAVDALTAGLPVVTTRHPSHSPELEYLSEGETVLFSEHNTKAYAATVCCLMSNERMKTNMSRNCVEAADKYSLEAMLQNMLHGIAAWKVLEFGKRGQNSH